MSTFYVKRAGKLYGPFSFEQVTNCINRDIFSARDMISSDRVTWESVEEFRKKGKFFEEPAASAGSDHIALKKVSKPDPDIVPLRENGRVPLHPAGMDAIPNDLPGGIPHFPPPGQIRDMSLPGTADKGTFPVERLEKTAGITEILWYIVLGVWLVSFTLRLINEAISGIFGMVFFGIFYLVRIAFAVCGMIALYRAWQTIPREEARTTPGKAVGFLFIPFFNAYWIFVAFYGLASDLNARAGRVGLRPYASEGGILLGCILEIAAVVLGGILANAIPMEDDWIRLALCEIACYLPCSIMLVLLPWASWRVAAECNAKEGAEGV